LPPKLALPVIPIKRSAARQKTSEAIHSSHDIELTTAAGAAALYSKPKRQRCNAKKRRGEGKRSQEPSRLAGGRSVALLLQGHRDLPSRSTLTLHARLWCSQVRRLRSLDRRFSASRAGRRCTGTRGGGRIHIFKAWAKERRRRNKNHCVGRLRSSHSLLAGLSSGVAICQDALHASGNRGLVFPSFRKQKGREALCYSVFVATTATSRQRNPGSHIDGRPEVRGLHNLRQLASNWLGQAKVETQDRAGNPASQKIQTTLDLYTAGDSDENTGRTGANSFQRL